MKKEDIEVFGEVTIDIKSKDGSIRQIRKKNLVTSAGKDFFIQRIFKQTPDRRLTKIAIGTNTATAVVADTFAVLGANTNGKKIVKNINYDVSAILTDPGTTNSAIFVTNFLDIAADTLLSDSNVPLALGEIGLIATGDLNSSPVIDTLVCRTIFDQTSPETTFTKQTTDVITVTWKITVN
jgi:hypothetical protein